MFLDWLDIDIEHVGPSDIEDWDADSPDDLVRVVGEKLNYQIRFGSKTHLAEISVRLPFQSETSGIFEIAWLSTSQALLQRLFLYEGLELLHSGSVMECLGGVQIPPFVHDHVLTWEGWGFVSLLLWSVSFREVGAGVSMGCCCEFFLISAG